MCNQKLPLLFLAFFYFGANGASSNLARTREGCSTSKAIIDSRPDGVSYDADLAVCEHYLKLVSPSDKLDDFSKAGHHILRLDSNEETTGKFLSHLLQAGFDDTSTWEFEIFKEDYYPPAQLNLSLVAQFFQAAPVVTSIRWSSVDQLPRALLRTIEQHHPTAKLHYSSVFTSESFNLEQEQYKHSQDETDTEVIFRDSPDIDRFKNSRNKKERVRYLRVQEDKQIRKQNREALVGSTILHSLNVGPTHENVRPSEKIDLVHRILLTCPNIKQLKLAMGLSMFGGQLPGLNFEVHNHTLPPIKILELSNYPFAGKPSGNSWMEWEVEYPSPNVLMMLWNWLPVPFINCLGCKTIQELGGVNEKYEKRERSPMREGTRTNLDFWLERMDWSKLQNLKLDRPEAYELKKFSGDLLSGLTTISFNVGNRNATVIFLESISQSLESISITSEESRSPDDILDVVLQKHSQTLKSLTLRHAQMILDPDWIYSCTDQGAMRYPKTSFLTKYHLTKLLQKSPHLKVLDIDFRIGDSWDYDVLDTLAKFEALTELKLAIDDFVGIPKRSDGDHHEAWMSKVGIEGYLKKNKKGVAFTELEISFTEYRVGSHY